MRRAKVYLAGAGPGDPELLTVKAARILREADAVIYDRLVSAEVLALANPNATFIYAGKAQGQQEQIQSEIYEWILRLASKPITIVRLKSGDPAVFGRLGEELEFLAQNGIEAEVIPGVSSALAGPTGASIPLTYRGVAGSFSIIAGHREGLTHARLVRLQGRGHSGRDDGRGASRSDCSCAAGSGTSGSSARGIHREREHRERACRGVHAGRCGAAGAWMSEHPPCS